MLEKQFVADNTLKMFKRYQDRPRGICSTSLWLFTTYEVFPINSEIFSNTLNALLRNLYVEAEINVGGKKVKIEGLRRYAISENVEEGRATKYVTYYLDGYWGGQDSYHC